MAHTKHGTARGEAFKLPWTTYSWSQLHCYWICDFRILSDSLWPALHLLVLLKTACGCVQLDSSSFGSRSWNLVPAEAPVTTGGSVEPAFQRLALAEGWNSSSFYKNHPGTTTMHYIRQWSDQGISQPLLSVINLITVQYTCVLLTPRGQLMVGQMPNKNEAYIFSLQPL